MLTEETTEKRHPIRF